VPAPASQPRAAPPPDTHVAIDTPCVACGYNLRTLPVAGMCPECHAPVDEALRSFNGFPVPRGHHRKLAWGFGLLATGPPLGLLALFVVPILADMLSPRVYGETVIAVTGAFWFVVFVLIPVLLLTVPDPRPVVRTRTSLLRHLLRVATLLSCAALALLLLGSPGVLRNPVSAVLGVVALAWPFLLLRYTAAVAASFRPFVGDASTLRGAAWFYLGAVGGAPILTLGSSFIAVELAHSVALFAAFGLIAVAFTAVLTFAAFGRALAAACPKAGARVP
jgi:hypothetical protein